MTWLLYDILNKDPKLFLIWGSNELESVLTNWKESQLDITESCIRKSRHIFSFIFRTICLILHL